MALTQEQGTAILGTLRADTQAALQRALDAQAKAESGVVHSAFAFLGLGADNAVDAVPGDLRMQLHAADSLERSLPAAVADSTKADGWLSTARYMEKSLATYAEYQQSASIDSILAQTADATASEIKDAANTVAKKALSLSWKALPWWAWLAAALAAFFFLVPATLRKKVLPA